MAFASLKYDFLFKEVFSNERILRRFISDVTGIPLSEIKSVRVVNPHLWKRHRRQKQGILDVALVMNDDTRIDIELQLRRKKFLEKRFLFYLAKMYTEDLKFGEDYARLRKCIAIDIVDFTMVSGERNHSVFTLRDKDGVEFTDLFEIHIIELNKKLQEDDALGDWIRLFNADTKEKVEGIRTQITEVQEAMEMVKRMNLTRTLRWMVEQHLKERRDRHAEDEYVRDEGRAEGRVEGLVKGRVEGRVEGRAMTLIQLVCNKLSKGKTIETIAEELEESPAEISRICAIASKYAPDYDVEKIVEEYLQKENMSEE